jgi:hypothetical protein
MLEHLRKGAPQDVEDDYHGHEQDQAPRFGPGAHGALLLDLKWGRWSSEVDQPRALRARQPRSSSPRIGITAAGTGSSRAGS